MKVIYEDSVVDKIAQVISRSLYLGTHIKRIELTTKEMDVLEVELCGKTSGGGVKPRVVPFKGFNVVEVFNAE